MQERRTKGSNNRRQSPTDRKNTKPAGKSQFKNKNEKFSKFEDKKTDKRTDNRTDKRTDRRTDNRTDKRTPRFKKEDVKRVVAPRKESVTYQNQNIDMIDEEAAERKEGLIAGRRAVLELLKSGRQINKIFAASGEREGSVKEIVALAKESRIPVVFVDKVKLEDLVPGEKHQGIVASVPPVNYVDMDELLARETALDVIIMLDGIEDPHNLGAIIRSAEVVGAKGIIIPKRRGVLLTETVAKASAGAIMHLPVARVANLVETAKMLKNKGYWVAGADMSGKELWSEDLKTPLLVVIGGEGKGISRLLKENCDFLVGIPVKGQISSLNASVASGVILYEIARQNTGK